MGLRPRPGSGWVTISFSKPPNLGQQGGQGTRSWIMETNSPEFPWSDFALNLTLLSKESRGPWPLTRAAAVAVASLWSSSFVWGRGFH